MKSTIRNYSHRQQIIIRFLWWVSIIKRNKQISTVNIHTPVQALSLTFTHSDYIKVVSVFTVKLVGKVVMPIRMVLHLMVIKLFTRTLGIPTGNMLTGHSYC